VEQNLRVVHQLLGGATIVSGYFVFISLLQVYESMQLTRCIVCVGNAQGRWLISTRNLAQGSSLVSTGSIIHLSMVMLQKLILLTFSWGPDEPG
jgi:hypothetical protein